MSFIPNSKLPDFIVFLDIDGVLRPQTISREETEEVDRRIYEKKGELLHSIRCENCVSCDTELATLFKKKAVETFEKLIAKIQKIANVYIVISSAWRKNRTVDELITIFSSHEFSKYIVDKTTNDKLSFEENDCCAKHFQNSYICRASQINKWLKSYKGYAGYLVFDDKDSHLGINFKDKFISTNHDDKKILKPEDTEKAYNIAVRQIGEYNVSFNT